MKALKLIIQREYLTRIKKKSFIILTLLMPVFIIATIFVPMLLAGIKDSESKQIVVIDTTGKYASHLQSFAPYEFKLVTDSEDNYTNKVGKEIFGILQINSDLSVNPKAAVLISEKQAPMDIVHYINHTFSEVVKSDKLKDFASSNNIEPQLLADVQQILKSSESVKLSTIRWSEDGTTKESSTGVAIAVGTLFTILMYMFILMYGAMVMNGVVEEKSNRIVEVMISSVRPFDLMMGKIIGIGLTGLTQLILWIVLVGGMLSVKDYLFPGSDGSQMSGFLANINMIFQLNWIEILGYFLFYFIGGYLIYAAIFAMFGAAVDNAQDTQQYMMPVTLIFIFALYAGMYSLQNPDGPLAFWCSMIPLTSPIVMMVRVPFGMPLWEKLLSMVILITTIILVVKFAAKIYRVGILMYGKKPSIKEVLKWFNYK